MVQMRDGRIVEAPHEPERVRDILDCGASRSVDTAFETWL
jgi:hypothetical protein